MRRHYTNYFKAFPGIKPYRAKLVTEYAPDAIFETLDLIEKRYAGFERREAYA